MPNLSNLTQPPCYFSWSHGSGIWAGLMGVCSPLFFVMLASGSVLVHVASPSTCFLILHMSSLPLLHGLSTQWDRLDFLAWQWDSKSESWSRHGSPRKLSLLLSIGQSKSPVQLSFKEWGNRLYRFMGVTAKWLCNWHGPGRFDSL